MSKRLVVCCDGTWNTAEQSSPTNVTKVYGALSSEDHVGTKQCKFYHPGVGVKRSERLIGGIFGFGLSRNVKDTYRFVVENFEPGDELFFFGFSRGAFTARSTAGLVRNAGILRREHADRLDEAYALYRSRTAHPRSAEAQAFRDSYSYETRIRFIGVWDTVGALGIPLSPGRWVNFINRRWQFHDTDLSTKVEAAFQALAIDEKRPPFSPTMWTQQPDAPANQQVEQVWFTGVHCDVGGGYPQRALAEITLRWLVSRARWCGLAFDDGQLDTTAPDPMGELHESRTMLYKRLPPFVRAIGAKDPTHESAASGAVERHKADSAYSPPGLIAYLNGPYRETQI
jgi:uncharacterized protein (DUF2235 family)